MKLFQLRAALAVAECGNFSEAALQLELSQPAVSHAILTLEDDLGIPLFTRGHKGAVLTPAGEQVLAHAHRALQELDLMQKTAYLQRGLQGGQVRIASFRSVATHILPKVMVHFRDRFPNIDVTIIERPDYLDIEKCLREGRAEIGITYLPTSDEFEVWELVRDEYIVLMPPQYSSPHPLTWEHLSTYKSVQLPYLPCGQKLQCYLQEHAPLIQANNNIQEDSTIVSMVMQGLSPAILPRLAAEPIPPEIALHSLPNPYERVIGVAMLSNSLHVPAVFAFLEVLRQEDFSHLAMSASPI